MVVDLPVTDFLVFLQQICVTYELIKGENNFLQLKIVQPGMDPGCVTKHLFNKINVTWNIFSVGLMLGNLFNPQGGRLISNTYHSFFLNM